MSERERERRKQETKKKERERGEREREKEGGGEEDTHFSACPRCEDHRRAIKVQNKQEDS